MKANAPEKIYLYPSNIKEGKILGRWFKTRYNQDSVEYTRTDTLEVKWVDLEEEVESLIKSSIWRFEDKEDFLRVAKHFFELGLHCSQTDDSYIEGVKGCYTTTDKD